MNWYQIFDLGLTLLEGVLKNMKGTGATVEQLENAQAAIESLRKFHGSSVTKAQMESLRG